MAVSDPQCDVAAASENYAPDALRNEVPDGQQFGLSIAWFSYTPIGVVHFPPHNSPQPFMLHGNSIGVAHAAGGENTVVRAPRLDMIAMKLPARRKSLRKAELKCTRTRLAVNKLLNVGAGGLTQGWKET